MTTATAEITITPAMMAKAFWGMSSTDQVEFFRELATVIKVDHEQGNSSAYSLGELQWFYLGDDMHKSKQARDMLMTMAAPLYLHTLRMAGQ